MTLALPLAWGSVLLYLLKPLTADEYPTFLEHIKIPNASALLSLHPGRNQADVADRTRGSRSA
jgi:hypothetical protein